MPEFVLFKSWNGWLHAPIASLPMPMRFCALVTNPLTTLFLNHPVSSSYLWTQLVTAVVLLRSRFARVFWRAWGNCVTRRLPGVSLPSDRTGMSCVSWQMASTWERMAHAGRHVQPY